MRLCLQNLNRSATNVTGDDRSTLLAATALVLLLHGGLAFWFAQAVVKPEQPKEKLIEIAMLSVAAPKPVVKPPAVPSADNSEAKAADKQVPVQKTLAAKVPLQPVLKKPMPAKPIKPKPIFKEALPAPPPIIPAPLSPPVAIAPPAASASPPASNTELTKPAASVKASPSAVSLTADKSAASSAIAGNPVACVTCPQPNYPAAARRRNMQGVVQLKLELSAQGKVLNVTVLQSSGHEVLDEAAVSEVREWVFAPGQPGLTRIATQRITFKM